MEWVETTGKSLVEAKSLALDRLGVDENDAEFEVLDEPRPGLFGRMRGEARVRARVRPTHPRPKVERRRGRKAANGAETPVAGDVGADEAPTPKKARPAKKAAGTATAGRTGTERAKSAAAVTPDEDADQSVAPATRTRTRAARPAEQEEATMSDTSKAPSGDLVDEATAASEFLRGLLDAMGTSGTIASTVDDDDVEVTVEGDDLGLLIGPRGATLQSVQELTRLAVQQRRDGERGAWIHVDVSGYRAKRREALIRFTTQVAGQVVAGGSARALEPMSAADRKIVHDAAGEIDGVRTTSEGEDPNRRVVVHPAD